ncbi:MAG: hypothetical protein WA746_18560 [Isosphaeraceae bacterium]
MSQAIVRGLATRLHGQAGGDVSEDRALAVLALCVGGLGVARSVQDEALAERILVACRDLAKPGLFADASVQTPARPARKRKAK